MIYKIIDHLYIPQGLNSWTDLKGLFCWLDEETKILTCEIEAHGALGVHRVKIFISDEVLKKYPDRFEKCNVLS